jgi:hypothetical protein
VQCFALGELVAKHGLPSALPTDVPSQFWTLVICFYRLPLLLHAVMCFAVVLQAAVLGLDIRRHSELAMRPGEVRPLLLSRQQPDLQPMTIPCPRPPACV